MTITEYTVSPAAAATGDVFSVYCKVQMGEGEYADSWICMLNKFGETTFVFLYYETGGAIPAGGSATMSFTTANLSRGSVTLTRGDELGLRVIAYHGSSPTYDAVTSASVCTWLGGYGKASITTFNVRRFSDGVASDVGTVAALDLKIATGLPDAATCKITYKESDSETFSAPISVTLASAQAGMTANTTILSAVTLKIGTAYDFRVTVGDAYESAIKQVRVSRGIGKLNISRDYNGVAIGKLSTATAGNPKFECAYPAHFYGGIPQYDYSTSAVDTGIKWTDGKTIYRKVLTFTTTVSQYTLSTGVSAIDTLVSVRGMLKSGSNIFPVPRAHTGAFSWQISVYLTNATSNPDLIIDKGSSHGDLTGFMVIEFTKPT